MRKYSVKSVVFDVGNVLLKYEPQYIVQRLMPGFLEKDLLEKLIFHSRQWHYLDCGLINDEQFIAQAVEIAPQYSDEIKLISGSWHTATLEPITENIRLVKLLIQKGVPVYILSNIQKTVLQIVKEKFDLFEAVNGAVFSCEAGVSKPDQAIYLTLLKQYGLRAEDLILFDDVEASINTARSLGIKSVLVTEQVRIAEFIEKHLEISF